MELTIRKYELEDIDYIAEMQKLMNEYHIQYDNEYYKPAVNASHEFAAYLRKKIDDESFHILIAEYGGNAAGYVMGWLEKRPPIYENQNTAYLSNIFVKEEFRNSGIGKKLYQEMEKWYVRNKVDFIEIKADARNTETLNKFRNSGFKDQSITFYKKVVSKK